MRFTQGVVVKAFLAPLPLACSLLGILCHIVAAFVPIMEVDAIIEACMNNYRVLTVMPALS